MDWKLRRIFAEHPRTEWCIPALLAVLMLAQIWASARQMSQHVDEAVHLYAGYRLLKCGDYSFGREHPPLAKVLAAAPLLWSDIPVDCAESANARTPLDEDGETVHWFFSQANWWAVLLRARAAMALAVVALTFAIWLVARRWFGLGAATLATALFAFDPNFIAHGALVLNNILLALLFLCTIYAYYQWTEQRQGFVLLGSGVLLGLTLLSKHNAAFLVFVLAGLATVEPWLARNAESVRRRRALRNLGAVSVMILLAVATIWGFYGMRYSQVGRQPTPFAPQVIDSKSLGVRVLTGVRSAHLLPQAYVDGVIDVVGMVHDSGNGGAVLNRHYETAPWFTFPLTLIVKLTLGCLGLLVVGAIGIRNLGAEHKKRLVFLLPPALLYLGAATAIPRFSGIWHLFPAIPFLLIAASAGAISFATRYRRAPFAVGGLLVLHLASSLHAYPRYLSYANEAWGGEKNLYRLLPYTDLGQTLWEVRRYMEAHPGTPCLINVDWPVPVARYGIPCTQTGSRWIADVPTRMKGIVFVSATWWQMDDRPGDPLDSFRDVKPVALLGGSAMLVYEGEFDTHLLAARAIETSVKIHLNDNDFPGALAYARQAVAVAPESGRAHHYYCVALAEGGDYAGAYSECKVALQLSASYAGQRQESELLRTHIATLGKQLGLPEDGSSR